MTPGTGFAPSRATSRELNDARDCTILITTLRTGARRSRRCRGTWPGIAVTGLAKRDTGFHVEKNSGTASIERGFRVALALVAAAVFLTVPARFYLTRSASIVSSPAPIFAEARGDVRNPGIYVLDRGRDSVAGLLDAAGGLGPGITMEGTSGIGFTQRLKSGQAVQFAKGPSGAPEIRIEEMQAAALLTVGGKLDLNRAGVKDLCLIPRMKPETASAIVARRAERPWNSLHELGELPGIGPKTIENWREYLEAAPVPPAGTH